MPGVVASHERLDKTRVYPLLQLRQNRALAGDREQEHLQLTQIKSVCICCRTISFAVEAELER